MAAMEAGISWGVHRRSQLQETTLFNEGKYPWDRGKSCEEWHMPLGAWEAPGFLRDPAPAPTCTGADCEPPYERHSYASDAFCVPAGGASKVQPEVTRRSVCRRSTLGSRAPTASISGSMTAVSPSFGAAAAL